MNSKYDLEGNGLKGQMATSTAILVVYRAHIVMDIYKTSAYTMYRHKKIAQSLNVQSEFTPLHTSSSFLAGAQYFNRGFHRSVGI